MSLKKFQWGKIFKIDIFVLKHVLDHSKSIPTKKNFSKNFRKIFDFLVIFCHFWAQKIDFLNFLGENFWNFISPISKGLYCGHFAPLYASLGRQMSPCAAMRSNFHQNRPKIEVFGIFRVRKNRNTYFLSSNRLKDFITVILSHHRDL